MTFNILNRRNAPRNFGAIFRQTRPGPERKLVEHFLEELPLSVPRGCNTTVFCEPRIESGFPDLVIVLWSTAVAKTWRRSRVHLVTDDFRLIHYLHQAGPLLEEDLRKRLLKPVARNLARLEAADMAYCVGHIWRPRPLYKSFAARRIIAIEAKVSEWTRALGQAVQNTWFASDSFVLLPKRIHAKAIPPSARSFGVRICAPGDMLSYKNKAASSCLPRSYASWLFNEWAWRFANV
jgi:hypothetical protein